MRRLTLFLLPLSLLLLARPALAGPDGIAVVNMADLLSSHPRIKEIEKKFDQRQKEAETYASDEKRRIDDLRQEIDLMNRNNPVRRTKEKQLLFQQAQVKFELDWRKEEAVREYMTGLENLYAEVRSQVAQYARENGLQLVLQLPPEELQAADFNDYFAKVQLRTVVFSAAALDITPRIKAMFPAAPPERGNR